MISMTLSRTLRHLFLLTVALVPFFLSSCDTAATIINNVSERDANEIIVLLAGKGISAQKIAAPKSTTGGGSAEQLWDISVSASHLTEAISMLNQAGLPRQKSTTLLDLFGSQGLVPSDMQDKIRYQEGLSEQLATTIRKMDGVLDANVQITFPQTDEDQKKALTASVYVKYRGMADTPGLLVTKIKRLVSSSLPGLTIENVSVVTDKASYAETFSQLQGCSSEVKSYVSIWSIILAKESVLRFRVIFYAFLIVIFILLAALIWVLWLFYPLIVYKGGLKALGHKEPYRAADFREEENKATPEVERENL